MKYLKEYKLFESWVSIDKWEDLKADNGKSGLSNIKWKLLEEQKMKDLR